MTDTGTEYSNKHCSRSKDSNTQCISPSKTTDSCRRVIFPSLHKSTSTPNVEDIRENFPSKTSLVLRRSASFESPRSVVIADVNAQYLPSMPSLVPLDGSREVLKAEPSNLIISPFNRTATPAPYLISKRPLSSKHFCDSSKIKQGKKRFGKLESSLRKVHSKSDFAPAGVFLSQSENSLLERRVCFDPHVWVHEFKRDKDEFENTWFSAIEMEQFKKRAIDLVCGATQLVPTGTGRLVQKFPAKTKAIFTHPALLSDDDEDSTIKGLTESEICRILVVDPHDLCSKLFSKSLRKILPHAEIEIALSSDEALRRIERNGTAKSFDLVLVEERLKMVQDRDNENASGSGLIKMLKKDGTESAHQNRQPLFVGVSAHFAQDKDKLLKGGASLVW
eukprot:CAMPEP_0194218844 /NCGR_PEP_ID=MMETSP0156-20130528/24617_1 /TAXON_ID=33649 /ORGANISM="Thalassionema nitzschioides, Strain L26-B" /LENGTH=391 /DNA_ID=CAMNT_0038948319 /DNA_START=82 /DNA_END=1254 /DNA_ORIENTATION=+